MFSTPSSRTAKIAFLRPIFLLGASLTLATAAVAQSQPSVPNSVSSQPQSQDKDDWQFTLSAGVLVMPNYPGDDEYLLAPIPNIQIQYKDIVNASVQGIEVTPLRFGDVTIGGVLRPEFGRDEDGAMPFAVVGGSTDELDGLGNISITPEVGGFIRYNPGDFTLTAEMRQGLGGHEGLVGNLSATYNTQLNWGKTGAFLQVGPSITFADNTYNEAFFGIDAEQSAASGLAQFDADSSVNNVGLDLFFVKPLSRRVSVVAFANYDRLIGDPSDSPLVQERGSDNQFMAGLFVGYTF